MEPPMGGLRDEGARLPGGLARNFGAITGWYTACCAGATEFVCHGFWVCRAAHIVAAWLAPHGRSPNPWQAAGWVGFATDRPVGRTSRQLAGYWRVANRCRCGIS